jgi:hypothetical protein
MAQSESVDRRGSAATRELAGRGALARRTLAAARAVLPPDRPLELVLAEDATAARTSAVRVPTTAVVERVTHRSPGSFPSTTWIWGPAVGRRNGLIHPSPRRSPTWLTR